MQTQQRCAEHLCSLSAMKLLQHIPEHTHNHITCLYTTGLVYPVQVQVGGCHFSSLQKSQAA